MKAQEETAKIQLSEIRSGNHFFFQVVGDESSKVITDSMKAFTSNNGTDGAPCDVKVGKLVAALFNDGDGKSWYRAKIIEKKGSKATVLFLDHGNLASVPIATHLRPLDPALGTDRIPAAAKEAVLALTKVRDINDEYGHEAGTFLQAAAWGKEITARIFCQSEGKLVVALTNPDNDAETINEALISSGLALNIKPREIDILSRKMVDSKNLKSLSDKINSSLNKAKRSRVGMWRYGDIDDDEEDGF